MPVGHIWKFDLEEHKLRNFGRKFNFSKIRLQPVMLNFLANTENLRNRRSEHLIYNRVKEHPIYNRGKEPSYPEIGEETIAKEEYDYSS